MWRENSRTPALLAAVKKLKLCCGVRAEGEDAEVELLDPSISGGEAHGTGGGKIAQAAPEEEEYYDDEGADHDREDDEE